MQNFFRNIFVVYFMLAINIFSCSVIKLTKQIKPQATDWIQYGGNHLRTNYSKIELTPPLVPVWEYDAEAGFGPYSLTASDSILFVGNLRGDLHLVDIQSGNKIKKQKFGTAITGPVALTTGAAYIALLNNSKTLGKFDLLNGKYEWTINVGQIETPPLLYGNQVFVASLEGKLSAINVRTGILNWEFVSAKKNVKPMRSAPATNGNTVVVGSDDDNLYAVDIDNGKLKWKYTTDKSIFSSPSIVGNAVVFGSLDGYYYCVNITDGNLIWKKKFSAPIFSSQAVSDSFVYVGASDGMLRCLDITDGTEKWNFKAQSNFYAAPIISGNILYIGSLDKKLYALNIHTGNLIWSYLMKSRIKSSPVIWGGYLFVLTDNQIVTAFVESIKDFK
ncbi:MAG: PQQ-binding-like beta-propeller repeat protein [Bacteroidota bacterium]|nr:PQQ-binding-like beta-propeller repeat protein [Bacteroidota bacterium]